MAKPSEFRTPKQLNWYGLPAIGYDDYLRQHLQGNLLADQLAIEGWCFRMGMRRDEGGLGKFGHFKNIVDLLWNNADAPSQKRFVWHRWSEKMLSKACEHDQLGVAGPSSSGKSDPFALWVFVNYLIDPTHIRGLVMSTSIGGAKLRIWSRLLEYADALPDYPGQYLKSANRILGPNYEENGVGESSGILLLAGEKSKDKDALDKLIGIKAPKTGDADEEFAALRERDEFAHLVEGIDDEEYLRDLLPRLLNLSEDRIGKLILVADEATGISDAVRNAINGNMLPGNRGHAQVVMLGNPNLHWDTFGLFCEPKVGWDHVTLNDEEWETKSGGLCIRFNAEKSPRVVDNNTKLTWMQTEEEMEGVARDGGGKASPMYYRFVLGFWCPEGATMGVYSQSNFEQGGAFGPVTWSGPQTMHSSLDPSFTAGGDKAPATFFKFGRDMSGKQVMCYTERIAIEVDAGATDKEVSFQIVENWRKECTKRGVSPHNACFDSGGSPAFADIVRRVWSPQVQALNASGKASDRPVGHEKKQDGSRVLCRERFANKVTEVWFGALPFMRSGQIKGVPLELAKEMCLRRLDDKSENSTGRLVKVESKRVFRSREGFSPDDSDSFLIGVEHLRTRHGFTVSDEIVGGPPAKRDAMGNKVDAWSEFKARARRTFASKRNLKR